MDIQTTVNNLLFVLGDQLKSLGLQRTPEVVEAIGEIMTNAQNRLLPLATGFASTDPKEHLDEEFVMKQLKEQDTILKADLNSLAVLGEGIVQEARDNAIQTMATTILAVVLQVLTKA